MPNIFPKISDRNSARIPPARRARRRRRGKRRKRAFATIDAMLGGNFALIVRDHRSRPFVVMTVENFAALADAPEEIHRASSRECDKGEAGRTCPNGPVSGGRATSEESESDGCAHVCRSTMISSKGRGANSQDRRA